MIPDVSAELRALASREFRRLMSHPTNREDALQDLRLVELATHGGPGAAQEARHMLAWREYALGLVPRPPSCPIPPYFPDPIEAVPSLLEAEYVLRVAFAPRRGAKRPRVA